MRAREHPTAVCVGPRADSGAERAGHEKGRDINPVKPTARLGRDGEDRAHAEDDIRLHAKVDGDRGRDKNRQRKGRPLPRHGDEEGDGYEHDAAPVAARLKPRSARRPAIGAATAPETPASANSAMPRWVSR